MECVRGDELSVSSCCWRPWQASTMWTDSEGRTAVIAACYMGHMPAVRELINWDADIEATNYNLHHETSGWFHILECIIKSVYN